MLLFFTFKKKVISSKHKVYVVCYFVTGQCSNVVLPQNVSLGNFITEAFGNRNRVLKDVWSRT